MPSAQWLMFGLALICAGSPAIASGAPSGPEGKAWPGGWHAATIRVTEPGLTSRGDLRPALAARDGWMYFGYGDGLYRIDSLAGKLTRIRTIPDGCAPVVDEAMRFSCGGDGAIARLSNGRTEVLRVVAPSRCSVIPPGATTALSVQGLAPRGSSLWFSLPRADGVGSVAGRASKSWCVGAFRTPRQVVPTARGVWFTDDAGDVALLRDGRVRHAWRGLARALGGSPSLAPDMDGGVFVVAASGETLLRLSADGRCRDFRLPHPALGVLTTDRSGRCWVELLTRRSDDDYPWSRLRIGLLRIDARGTRFFDVPLNAGSAGIVADRRGRLWLNDGHQYIVLTPPKDA
ncbi:MAG TPA: hypothetical protein VFB22_12090 [Candidatus Baltobacteraceae bacterium]|nr:hypothetical protein [Candidatus Baltobacteraceae bacterium]